MKTCTDSVPNFSMSNLEYADEYNEPALTFEQEDEVAEMMEQQKTAECEMCFGLEEHGNMITRHFYIGDTRSYPYEIQLCPRCCDRWDNTPTGNYNRCIVCHEGCSVPGEDCVEVVAHEIPANQQHVFVRGVLCAECCDRML